MLAPETAITIILVFPAVVFTMLGVMILVYKLKWRLSASGIGMLSLIGVMALTTLILTAMMMLWLFETYPHAGGGMD